MTVMGLTVVVLLQAGPAKPPKAPAKTPPPAASPAPAAPAASAPAAPEKPPDDDTLAAKKYFQWAQSLYKQARYSEAIAKFEEAYRLKPHPTIFFNIGRCYEQLGDIPRALKNYRDYLRIAPDAKDRELVTDAIANLERRLKEQGVQQLAVLSEPSGARVTVDERYMGLTPLTIELKPGNRLIALTKEGFEPIEKNVILSADKSMELNLILKAKVLATPPPEPPKPVVLTPSPTIVKPVEPAAPPPPTRVYTWVATAVAGAGLATGVTLGIFAGSASTRLRGSLHPQDEAQALHDQAQSLALGANIAYATAATGLVAAVVLFFLEPTLTAPKSLASAQ
ncbi:MAG: PEGA domain-containing protein [Myxococcaceae bacterium]|nr:PEGA domain-containing protein [Myxococcaceae bacterium]